MQTMPIAAMPNEFRALVERAAEEEDCLVLKDEEDRSVFAIVPISREDAGLVDAIRGLVGTRSEIATRARFNAWMPVAEGQRKLVLDNASVEEIVDSAQSPGVATPALRALLAGHGP
jgi:hypothetical protein